MPDLPSATTTIDDTAGAKAGGTNRIAIIAPVASSADATPRFFANAAAILALHGYSDGVDYAAIHIEETKQPVLFCGVPIATPGALGRENTTGNSGTSVTTLSGEPKGEHDGVLTVIAGGTIGTSQILLGLSLDGGRSLQRVRLGTANSYLIPHIGVTISFAAGTLVAGDTIHEWHGSAPRWDAAGLLAARTALAAQEKSVRSWLIVGDLAALQDATDVTTQVNAYETANERFVYARASVRDRLPIAAMSQTQVRMTGNPAVTFAEVGGTGDTITRASGSWIADGFAVGMSFEIAGSVSNDLVSAATIVGVTATVLTLDTDDLAAEGPVSNVEITGTPSLTFAEVGGTGDTITRAGGGSWIDDGFRVGDLVTIADTVSNDLVAVAGLAAVTATVLTFDTTDLAAEVIGSFGVSITAGESKAVHVAAMDALFASIDSQRRIDISLGRARKQSPILLASFRRPAAWAASIREYQHDVHISTLRKADGALDGWSLVDAAGNLVEYDDRVDGGALAGRFTCLRTWANGPAGAFVANSLTRAGEGKLLSRTNNMAVANVACSVNQSATENEIGQSLVLNDDGTATAESLSQIRERVNSELRIALFQEKVPGEGQRASGATWNPSTDDVLNDPDNSVLTGVLDLVLNGTVEKINTVVRVR
jgi:hypothetical protein